MQRERSQFYEGKRHLPLSSGPYTVGCCDVMTSYFKFGVFIRLYYPSKEHGILERHLQWPLWIPHKQYINGYATRLGVPPCIYKKIHEVIVGNLYIPAVWQAELKPTYGAYPIVIFSHGLSGWRTTYSVICMELASRGFVVAAIEHRDHSASASFYKKQVRMSTIGSNPGSSLCELEALYNSNIGYTSETDREWNESSCINNIGPFLHTKEWMLYHKPSKENEMLLRTQQMKFRMKECCEALDLLQDLNFGRHISNALDVNFNAEMFKGQLNLSQCFFIGHSFGGATGIATLATEFRFRAGIFLDPWMFPFFEDQSSLSKIAQPFLCLLIKSFQTNESLRVLKKLQMENSDAEFIVLKKAEHRDVCDTPFVSKYSFSLATKFGFKISKFSALDVTVDLILRFLGQQIGGCLQPGSSKLERLKHRYLSKEDFSSVENK